MIDDQFLAFEGIAALAQYVERVSYDILAS
jgi:hypothetical protein